MMPHARNHAAALSDGMCGRASAMAAAGTLWVLALAERSSFLSFEFSCVQIS
jgi:hypothetical protein